MGESAVYNDDTDVGRGTRHASVESDVHSTVGLCVSPIFTSNVVAATPKFAPNIVMLLKLPISDPPEVLENIGLGVGGHIERHSQH